MIISALPSTGRLLAGVATASVFAVAACSMPSTPAPQPAATSEAPTSEAPTSEAPTSEAPASPSPTATASSSPSAAQPTATPSGSAAPVAPNAAMLAAGATAARAVDDSTVVSIEAERSGWDVEVVTGDGGEQRLRTDSAGSAVTSEPTSTRPDADDRAENRRLAGADVTYREAAQIVLRAVSGAQLRELNLDEDDNRLRWEADVRVGAQQRTVELDADSGRILRNEVDD